ncbi:hypothetical protein [Pseudomonas profundi]|uniref:hypothetical protein n=1 Tax=Pseudomonas profundi TaxID=1981513 RepID=UPI00123BD134|nr:hypothetical protein [Pseudomonas profundi]
MNDDMNQQFTRPKAPTLPTLARSVNLMAPESHARELKALAGDMANDPAINSALAAQAGMVRGLAALEDVRKNKHPASTASQHLNKAADAYQRLIKANAARSDQARSQIRSRRMSLEAELAQRLGLTVSGDSTEIRQALRSMTSEERGKAVQAAIESRDGAVLAAVFGGRQITTGFTDVQRDSFRRRAEQLHAPELLALRQALDKAEALVCNAFDDLTMMDEAVAGAPSVRTEFERQSAAHDDAMLALARTLDQ